MTQTNTATAFAESLRVMYCEHWRGTYCEICAARVVSQRDAALAAAVRQQTVDAFLTEYACALIDCGNTKQALKQAEYAARGLSYRMSDVTDERLPESL